MSEIKSAIELAMERTKNLVMDDEEKKEFARKNLEERLRAVVRRFVEGMITDAEFIDEYEGLPREGSGKGSILVDIINEEFQASADKERLFALLQVVGGRAGGGLDQQASGLRSWFFGELKSREATIRKQIVSRLQELGISGSAIEPNIAEWPESQETEREIGGLMRSRLEQWKKALAARS